jgi:predicted nucleic acid-binding protein
MSVEVFLDTNVLLYAATGTSAELAKRERALQLIEARNFGISSQVLQEFYVNATTKVRIRMAPELALAWLEQFDDQPCIASDAALVKLGIAISTRYRISCWDAAILAATEALSAKVLYSEDLNHGQLYGSVRVKNPFRDL